METDAKTKTERDKFCDGLVQLADALRANPQLPLPHADVLWYRFQFKGIDEIRSARFALPVGKWSTCYGGNDSDNMWFSGSLGGVRINLFADRADVCERIVTKKTVKVQVPDPELVKNIPLVEREVVKEEIEWKCGS